MSVIVSHVLYVSNILILSHVVLSWVLLGVLRVVHLHGIFAPQGDMWWIGCLCLVSRPSPLSAASRPSPPLGHHPSRPSPLSPITPLAHHPLAHHPLSSQPSPPTWLAGGPVCDACPYAPNHHDPLDSSKNSTHSDTVQTPKTSHFSLPPTLLANLARPSPGLPRLVPLPAPAPEGPACWWAHGSGPCFYHSLRKPNFQAT